MKQVLSYDYELPEKFIAQSPASPRDGAKLMVYDTATDKIYFDTFLHLDKYLPSQSVLVFNNTKVVPARIILHKETGGIVELLLLLNERKVGEKVIKGLSDRKLTIGQKLLFDKKNFLTVVKQDEKIFYFEPSMSDTKLYDLLDKHGHTPIPKYIRQNKMSEHELREKYQAVFAKTPASVAAPTASLHFTDRLLRKLRTQGVVEEFVTLHVGMGTFAPVNAENFVTKKLFRERIELTIPAAQRLNRYKTDNRPLIAVGTTALRTLESVASSRHLGRVEPASKETDLFIFPPYEFRAVDGLITNFHLPGSSLIMLVQALLEHKQANKNVLELYKIAKVRGFRFYSFGDGMLII